MTATPAFGATLLRRRKYIPTPTTIVRITSAIQATRIGAEAFRGEQGYLVVHCSLCTPRLHTLRLQPIKEINHAFLKGVELDAEILRH